MAHLPTLSFFSLTSYTINPTSLNLIFIHSRPKTTIAIERQFFQELLAVGNSTKSGQQRRTKAFPTLVPPFNANKRKTIEISSLHNRWAEGSRNERQNFRNEI